jgi:hypothetical protein
MPPKMKKDCYHCEYLNWDNQKGGLRTKAEGQQNFYAGLSSLAYKSTEERKKKAPKGFLLDEGLSNPDVAIFYNPNTKEMVSAVTGSRFGDKENRFRDIRSDLGIVLGVDRLGNRTKEVSAVVKKASAKYKDYDKTLTGHSLGGKVGSNISKQTGIPAVIFNQGSSPLSAVTDRLARMFGRDHKNSKVIHYTTGTDVLSISSKVLGNEDETNVVDMKPGAKKGIVENHSISNFTGEGKKPSPWIKHVKAYKKKHGCSYREAMTQGKASYKSK